ncbi:MAG: Calx-beta domain-containing protein, partial [Planctomycetota bacterium]
WIGLGACGTYADVGSSGIAVTLATGDAGACACRNPGGTGTLADVEADLLFANDENYSPGSDFIITLSNLTPGIAYRLLSYHNRSDEGDTTIPNVTITGATLISKPASIVQNHDIMDNPAECIFVAGAGDAVIRYQGPDGGCGGCQAFLNGFVLEISGPVIQFDSESSGDLESVSPAILTVVLSNPEAGETYSVDYAAVAGTATNGTDYSLAADTLTFNPGVTSQQIVITIINDGVPEDDETIIVELSNPTATSGTVSLGAISQHTYGILDTRVGVSFDTTASSGLEDVTPAAIAVTLSATVGEVVTVDYAASGGTAAGGGVDYQLLGAGTLQFAPGQLTRYIELAVVDDSIEEVPDETIELTLSNTSSNVKLGIPSEHTYTIIDNEEGFRWDGLTWYHTEYPNPLFVNEDGHLVWNPGREEGFITRLPEHRFSQAGDMVEISYWWMTDGDHDCDDCFDCDLYCHDDDITCIAGTSDMRAGFFEADGEYVTGDGFDAGGSSIFEGYKGYAFRFGPNMRSGPTRWVDCTGEVHKTGNFQKKPADLDNLMHTNDGLEDYIPGFELPPGEWSLWTISIERLSSSRVRTSITLNDRTYTWTDTDSGDQPTKIDVFSIYMRNGRPYSISELASTSPPPPPPPPEPLGPATDPSPTNGAQNADPNVSLTWTSAEGAVWHDVYFGSNFDSVENADIASSEYRDRQDYDVNTYDVFGLDLGANYHWRIDEISENDACKGDVWSFTVKEYLV